MALAMPAWMRERMLATWFEVTTAEKAESTYHSYEGSKFGS